jgi:hypothetical protein
MRKKRGVHNPAYFTVSMLLLTSYAVAPIRAAMKSCSPRSSSSLDVLVSLCSNSPVSISRTHRVHTRCSLLILVNHGSLLRACTHALCANVPRSVALYTVPVSERHIHLRRSYGSDAFDPRR